MGQRSEVARPAQRRQHSAEHRDDDGRRRHVKQNSRVDRDLVHARQLGRYCAERGGRSERNRDTDGRAGRKSLELILGIYESAKTGREVPLPLRVTI